MSHNSRHYVKKLKKSDSIGTQIKSFFSKPKPASSTALSSDQIPETESSCSVEPVESLSMEIPEDVDHTESEIVSVEVPEAMDPDANEAADVNDLLAEETEEEKQFHLNVSHQQSPIIHGAKVGIVHSATTDTLDSVYLEPAVLEQEIETTDINLESNEKAPGTSSTMADDVNTEEANPNQDSLPRQSSDIQFFMDSGDEKPHESPPSLSKYFGKDEGSDDPFANIGGVDDIGKPEEVKQSELDIKEDPVTMNTVQENDIPVDEMLDLTLNDSKDDIIDVTPKPALSENANNNNYRPIEDTTVESVDFDLTLDEVEKIETPVDIEEKDTFESFTADLADTETLDALGMSPAAPSYMTDRNLKDYFRQTSQADSVSSLHLGRQISQNSNKSSSSLDQNSSVAGSLKSETQDSPRSPFDKTNAVKETEAAIQTHTTLETVVEKHVEAVESVPTHQPMFPPSTTLSPVDSPAHQPAFGTVKQSSEEHPKSPPVSFPPTPEHRLTAFQTFTDTAGLEDSFAVSLQMSDADRQHDAWIPSEATKSILITMATHPPGSFVAESEILCLPILVITDPQGDPVRDLVQRYMGEQEALKRQVLSSDRVTQDFDGLQQLMKAGCYRSAIDLTAKLLTDMGHGLETDTPVNHSPESLQLWYCRFSLFNKLRLFSIAESEFVAFRNLDTPDIYYEYYPQLYPGKKGSMVRFGMRLLHAELPHHLGRSQESLDRLFYLLAIVQKIIKNLNDGLSEDGSALTISAESRTASQKLWGEREKQVLYSTANILVSLRDYDAALSVYDTLLEKDAKHKVALLSGIGRIHLQIGNLSKATEYFKRVNADPDPSQDENRAAGTLLMNRGFEAMCQNSFQEAYQNFKSAVQADPTNTPAINNMAVCCLYLGRLKDALKTLESLVHGNPDHNLHEGILFNLCTLYELESSRALHKKQALLDLVSKHKGDGFPVVCLKMQ